MTVRILTFSSCPLECIPHRNCRRSHSRQRTNTNRSLHSRPHLGSGSFCSLTSGNSVEASDIATLRRQVPNADAGQSRSQKSLSSQNSPACSRLCQGEVRSSCRWVAASRIMRHSLYSWRMPVMSTPTIKYCHWTCRENRQDAASNTHGKQVRVWSIHTTGHCRSKHPREEGLQSVEGKGNISPFTR